MQREPEPFDDGPEDLCKGLLFLVEPEGGPDQPESLLSWFIGLARAHSLSPRVLMKYLMEQSEAHRDVWNGTSFFERDCVTVNGFGKYARMAVDLLQPYSTAALAPLTLLEIAGLLPHNGEGALARHPRWCAFCLCDQLRLGQRPHLKLAWSFEHYRVCQQHRIPLSERCAACGSLQSLIPIYPSVVHCSGCGHPLLADLPEGEEPAPTDYTEFEFWCATTLEDLVSRRSMLGASGNLVTFRVNIDDIVRKLSPGNRKHLCESVGLQAYALNGWLNKDERPSLAVLLKFGFGVSVNIADLFLPGASNFAARPSGLAAVQRERSVRPMLGFERRHEMEKLLAVIIEDSTDCRPLSKVAERLGLTRSALKYWFRSDCREIVMKNRRFESRRLEVRYRADHDTLRSVIQGLRAKELDPSRRRVDAGLRPHRLSLARPDIFQAYERLRTALS